MVDDVDDVDVNIYSEKGLSTLDIVNGSLSMIADVAQTIFLSLRHGLRRATSLIESIDS